MKKKAPVEKHHSNSGPCAIALMHDVQLELRAYVERNGFKPSVSKIRMTRDFYYRIMNELTEKGSFALYKGPHAGDEIIPTVYGIPIERYSVHQLENGKQYEICFSGKDVR